MYLNLSHASILLSKNDITSIRAYLNNCNTTIKRYYSVRHCAMYFFYFHKQFDGVVEAQLLVLLYLFLSHSTFFAISPKNYLSMNEHLKEQ